MMDIPASVMADSRDCAAHKVDDATAAASTSTSECS